MSIEDKALDLIGQALSLLSQKQNAQESVPELNSDLMEKVKMYKRASILEHLSDVLASSGNTSCSTSLKNLSHRIKSAADNKTKKSKEENVMSKNEETLRDISASLDSKGHFKFASLVLDMAKRLKDHTQGCQDCACEDASTEILPQTEAILPEQSADLPNVETIAPNTYVLPQDIPQNNIEVIKESEAPDYLNKFLSTIKALGDIMDIERSTEQVGLKQHLHGITQRMAAQSDPSSPYLIRSLEDKFKSLSLDDPKSAVDSFKDTVQSLEATLHNALKKVQGYKHQDLNAMAQNALNDISKDPTKAKEKSEMFIRSLALFMKSIDNGIKNTIKEYNAK